MKNFSELSKQELSILSEVQVDAYIDIELANQNIVKSVDVHIDFPDYLKPMTVEPERDCTVYEVDGYNFMDKETAESFANFIGGLQQVTTNYNWDVGSEFTYVSGQKITTPSIQIKQIYSEPKYEAIKSQLKTIKQERENKNKKEEKEVESAIDYDAIDRIKQDIRYTVRQAVIFFEQARKYASNYDKYFSITEDKEKALSTIFTVFNVQDEEMKEQIKQEIDFLNAMATE